MRKLQRQTKKKKSELETESPSTSKSRDAKLKKTLEEATQSYTGGSANSETRKIFELSMEDHHHDFVKKVVKNSRSQ